MGGRAGAAAIALPTLLVTGAAGFIGEHIAGEGLARGFHVIGLSRPPVEPVAHSRDIEWLHCDLRDREGLAARLGGRRIEYVVNAAGAIVHAAYDSGGREVLETHFDGVRHLVDCLDAGALRAFVTLGSSDEYGDQGAPQSETMRERPISPYACAKTAAGHFLQMLARTADFPAIVLRLFLVYGPGQRRDRFLPFLIDGCLADDDVPVSAGEQLRDFTYIDDAVSAVFAAMESAPARGELINIGSGDPVRLRDMMRTVRDKIGAGRLQYGAVPYRNGENMALYPEIGKARRLLAWQPETPLSAGLDRTIEWYRRGSRA